ncbi:MAG: GtrA family protein [Patescibacteria group bacterium]
MTKYENIKYMPLISDWYNKFRNYFSQHYPRVYVFCDNRKSFIKFIFAGGLSGGIDLLLLFIFHSLLKIDIVFSTSLAFILAFLVSFSLQKFWTFRNYHPGQMIQQLSLYLINAFIGLVLNAFFMHLLVNTYNVWYLFAQIIVNLVIAVWNFIIYKFVVFKTNKNETNV